MRRDARWAAVGCLLLALTASAGCTAPQPTPAPSSQAPTIGPSTAPAAQTWWRAGSVTGTLASDLVAPWSVVPLDGGGALISERGDGTVLELTTDGKVRTIGVIPGVVSGGESGLHGLALLQTDDSRMLYAYFGAADDNRVARMPLLGEPGSFGLGEPEVILDGIARASTHDGGRLAFGPDGCLYVTTGDAQRRDAAQDRDDLGGKILRVTAEGDPAPGNPWNTRVWSMGHRNVQGIAWTADGTMWASEFGQNTWDELNRIEPGANYGWPIVEGISGREGFTDPVAQWPTSDASPSGIAARGDTVFMAGLRGERLWQIDTASGVMRGEPVAAFVGEYGRLRDVVAPTDGSLWLLTNNTDGRGAPRPGDDLLLRVELVEAP
ncbi:MULTISPECIES: PQQ-dependent sugar dehydrogenase [Microbacterium]|uniref:Quinoprotein glucose dehydrogenase B n=1 Tax=Microbacterium trichothecenolyticum TaxID=69370 RepID=A0A0M2H0C5_MICTR|nr:MULTISPECIES: PQQ-dependent sugar dehydrogenase [Microbacterium]KJL39826.1 Quinoprotein glucose dehydrogenase B precursor [Microbacterium trichothecenolyticum]MDR7189876.1 glucose/arabinose dehydrogenase [Microbacterium sp. BE35]